jgi:hypothetical protein
MDVGVFDEHGRTLEDEPGELVLRYRISIDAARMLERP